MDEIKINAGSLGEVLRATRGAARMSGREVAAAMGVSNGVISLWERNISEPSVMHFVSWAEATGQDPAALLRTVIAARDRG
ncbi:helix-turn-helix domain-containing protein, partial [Microbacterium enclense]|uniref:helix-turn-helix domain-containing protein n=2 Tax=Bacillati TaxID=1783272 RepID=UPI0036DF0464